MGICWACCVWSGCIVWVWVESCLVGWACEGGCKRSGWFSLMFRHSTFRNSTFCIMYVFSVDTLFLRCLVILVFYNLSYNILYYLHSCFQHFLLSSFLNSTFCLIFILEFYIWPIFFFYIQHIVLSSFLNSTFCPIFNLEFYIFFEIHIQLYFSGSTHTRPKMNRPIWWRRTTIFIWRYFLPQKAVFCALKIESAPHERPPWKHSRAQYLS